MYHRSTRTTNNAKTNAVSFSANGLPSLIVAAEIKGLYRETIMGGFKANQVRGCGGGDVGRRETL